MTLGDLIMELYEEFLILFGDSDKASLATAYAVNNILKDR